jgi:hypothetical protein
MENLRPKAGGYFDKSGALPETLWLLINEFSSPPPHTAETAMPPSAPFCPLGAAAPIVGLEFPQSTGTGQADQVEAGFWRM